MIDDLSIDCTIDSFNASMCQSKDWHIDCQIIDLKIQNTYESPHSTMRGDTIEVTVLNLGPDSI